MKNEKEIVIRCRAIILHGGRLLLVKHSPQSNFFALPGGHLELGEDIKTCLSREIVEELGIVPEIGRLLYINEFTNLDGVQSVEFFFEVTNGEDYLDIDLVKRTHSYEIDKMIWIAPDNNINLLPKSVGEDFKLGRLINEKTRFIRG